MSSQRLSGHVVPTPALCHINGPLALYNLQRDAAMAVLWLLSAECSDAHHASVLPDCKGDLRTGKKIPGQCRISSKSAAAGCRVPRYPL